MGGGPDKEHVVIILSDPEPEHITALLKRQFPYFDITYYQVSREGNGPKSKNLGSQVPDGEFTIRRQQTCCHLFDLISVMIEDGVVIARGGFCCNPYSLRDQFGNILNRPDSSCQFHVE